MSRHSLLVLSHLACHNNIHIKPAFYNLQLTTSTHIRYGCSFNKRRAHILICKNNFLPTSPLTVMPWSSPFLLWGGGGVGKMEAQSPRKLWKKRVGKMWIPLPEHLYKEFEVSKREQGVTVALHKNLHYWKEFEASINVKRSKLYRKS